MYSVTQIIANRKRNKANRLNALADQIDDQANAIPTEESFQDAITEAEATLENARKAAADAQGPVDDAKKDESAHRKVLDDIQAEIARLQKLELIAAEEYAKSTGTTCDAILAKTVEEQAVADAQHEVKHLYLDQANAAHGSKIASAQAHLDAAHLRREAAELNTEAAKSDSRRSRR